MTQPIPGNNTAKASSCELQTLRFKFLFNSTALSLLLLCSTVCCCCSCANDTRLEGLDSSKCSLRISKAKKYKAALTTESTQAIWHSGFSVSSLLQGSWHLPGHQPPVRVPSLIPVPSGMQPPDHHCVQLLGSETTRAKDGVTELGVGSSEAEPCAGQAEGEIGRCDDINRGVRTWSWASTKRYGIFWKKQVDFPLYFLSYLSKIMPWQAWLWDFFLGWIES